MPDHISRPETLGFSPGSGSFHEDYMLHIAGKGKYEYPGFSSDPLDGFKHLASDLEDYASDFLSGSGEEFKKAKRRAEERSKLSGFKRISKN
ncbi:MAG TPA: hypothetical protein VMV04_03440 [Thermodesulfobacteriota bacterium]|nr:hypothetical protein [Thermodesulfobacteriota bacterium]